MDTISLASMRDTICPVIGIVTISTSAPAKAPCPPAPPYTHQSLQKLRDQHGGPEQHHAEDKLQKHRGAEIAVLQQHSPRWVRVPHSFQTKNDQLARLRSRSQRSSDRRTSLLLAFVQHELQAADAHRNQPQTH